MPELRRLTPAGIDRFREYLAALRDDPALPPPTDLLTAADTSAAVGAGAVEPRGFADGLAWAAYIDPRLAGLRDVDRDAGLWAWLALFYFDAVCPPDAAGRRRPNRGYMYVPVNTDYRLYYRHLLAGPFRVYRAHRDDPARARAILCNPVHVLGHFVYQLASRQDYVTNPTVVGAATRLYVDPAAGGHKRGATDQKTPGSVFRFVDLLRQLDLTWDLCALTVPQLLARLPAEFDRFRPA